MYDYGKVNIRFRVFEESSLKANEIWEDLGNDGNLLYVKGKIII